MILPSAAAAAAAAGAGDQQEEKFSNVDDAMERKENEELLLFGARPTCDGSMSSIGSCTGVDSSSPKDVHQLCSTRRIINQILDDESAIRSPATTATPAPSHENLSTLEDRARVKLMCSSGGRIMPRPSDGQLRYVGGDTRLVTVNRDASYVEVMLRLSVFCEQPAVLKYQMPDEDLDALVSVCNDEDLENMMEEYDRLVLVADGSVRLRVFLFPVFVSNEEGMEDVDLRSRGYIFPADMDCFVEPETNLLEHQYIDAVNGVQDVSLRRDSGAGNSASVFNSGALDGGGTSYPGESLEFSSSLVQSRVGASSISSVASPSVLSPQTAASWMAWPKQCHSHEQSTEFHGSETPRAPPDFASSSNAVGDQKADILQLYPATHHEGGGQVHEEITNQQQSSPVHGPYPAHFANVGPHIWHGMPPPYHHAPSPACCGYSQRCMCTLSQYGRPPLSSQPFVRPVHDFNCGVYHGSHPCCCEHSADGRPVWWTRHCRQACVHCDLLQRQVLPLQVPHVDSTMPAAIRCPGMTSTQRLEQIHHETQGTELEGRLYSDSPRAVSSPLAVNGFVGKEVDSSANQPEKDLHHEGSHENERIPEPVDVLVVSSSVEMQTKVVDAMAHTDRLPDASDATKPSGQVSTLVFSTVSTRVVKSPAMKSLLSTSIHHASTLSTSTTSTTEPVLNKTTVGESLLKNDGEEKERIRSPTLQIWDNFATELDSKEQDPALQSLKDNLLAEADGVDNTALRAEKEAVSRGLQTIRNCDLEEIRQLGSGTFGTVFYGKWRGSEVAIKRIKPSCFAGRPSERDRLVADFWREAYTLSQLHHPNVVAFYGVVPDGPDGTLATVTEYMVNGSLKQVLHRKDRTIDRRKRLLIAMDAAIGMEYLHEKKIVHFDLKCENLLVNMRDPHRPICKVGDFGLSKVKHRTMVSGGVRGTLPWMAPELLNGSSSMVTEKVDIFSFGIVMWELLTGEEPYANMHYGAIIGGIVSNTLRPRIPDWCDPSWKSLMERCWGADPAGRPSFSSVAADLRAMTASPLQPKTRNQGPQAC